MLRVRRIIHNDPATPHLQRPVFRRVDRHCLPHAGHGAADRGGLWPVGQYSPSWPWALSRSERRCRGGTWPSPGNRISWACCSSASPFQPPQKVDVREQRGIELVRFGGGQVVTVHARQSAAGRGTNSSRPTSSRSRPATKATDKQPVEGRPATACLKSRLRGRGARRSRRPHRILPTWELQ